MRVAADFRWEAREALRGKWMLAVLVGLIAVLLGGAGTDGPEVEMKLEGGNVNFDLKYLDRVLFSTGEDLSQALSGFFLQFGNHIAVFSILLAIVLFLIGAAISVGYARFNLDLVDGREARFESLFGSFSHWGTMIAASFLQGLYIFLWSLLFVIPGIIASYSYAMTNYILAENPGMSADEAISRSKEMMSGNRFRLFCLQFSFIGWDFLCALTLGIGSLWLTPYKEAARAAFYREVSGSRRRYGEDGMNL